MVIRHDGVNQGEEAKVVVKASKMVRERQVGRSSNFKKSVLDDLDEDYVASEDGNDESDDDAEDYCSSLNERASVEGNRFFNEEDEGERKRERNIINRKLVNWKRVSYEEWEDEDYEQDDEEEVEDEEEEEFSPDEDDCFDEEFTPDDEEDCLNEECTPDDEEDCLEFG
ncbi:glutamic acid-rich protein-like [Hibiscus syriacus]|uniref:glutamic acid-rich protein-like n=1 Tax=Hibiscus syriacus TaxID=106335 RepID=UPI00192437B5|nr:glutamic acid-rich protein-like [Hibiscus syriacus]